MAAVVGPAWADFGGLVLGDAARLGRRRLQVDHIDLDVFVFFLTLVDGVAHEREFVAIGRGDKAIDAQWRGCDGAGAGREVGLLFGLAFFLCSLRRGGSVVRKSDRQVECEDRVTALGRAILHDVFPLLLVVVLLLSRPGLARGEVDGLRIGRPREGVDVFFSLGYGEGFAAVGRDEVDLTGGLVFRVRIRICVAALLRGSLALREEGDPAAVRRPLRIGVVSGLRQLNQIANRAAALAVVVIEPEIGAEDLLVPIRALGRDDHRVAVRRNLNRGKADGVEELVERHLGLALSHHGERTGQHHQGDQGSFVESHRVPGGKKRYTTADSFEASL